MPNRLLNYTLLAGLVAAWLGYFSAWVWPVPVALRLSAHDLVEWITFMQTVRDGTFPVSRLDLLWPLAGLALTTALCPAILTAQPKPPYLSHLLLLSLSLVAAFQILPAYPFILSAYNDPELAPQFWLGVVTGLAVVGLVGLSIFNAAWMRPLVVIIPLLSVITSIRALTLIQPPIDDILTRPAPIGFGFFLTVFGFAAVSIAASLITLRSLQRSS